MNSVLTGKEMNTNSGGVSRDPSAAAYTTANTNVFSHSTSRTERENRTKG